MHVNVNGFKYTYIFITKTKYSFQCLQTPIVLSLIWKSKTNTMVGGGNAGFSSIFGHNANFGHVSYAYIYCMSCFGRVVRVRTTAVCLRLEQGEKHYFPTFKNEINKICKFKNSSLYGFLSDTVVVI